MGTHVIVGAGPVGTALAAELDARGEDVLVLTRRGTTPPGQQVRAARCDAADAAALSAYAQGAVAIYDCVNPPYHRWATDWPPIAASMLAAAQRSGAVLVTLSNLYAYGPLDRPMTEGDPLAATSVKGQVRARMWQDALAAHEAGLVRATEVRASDFFGPGVSDGGFLGERAVPRILEGRSVTFLGNPDLPHSLTYVPDVAVALATVAVDPRAWGRPWHVPTAPAGTLREAVKGLADAAGVPMVKVKSLPWRMVRAAGIFSPQIREFPEIGYQFDKPFVLDSTSFTEAFGETATEPAAAYEATVRWWRDRRSISPSVASG
jgi:nucleoside-diphosphate-sugar epimerase